MHSSASMEKLRDVFKNLSFKQIYSLAAVLRDMQPDKIDFLAQRFNTVARNFEETLTFVKELNLLTEVNGAWKIERSFQEMISVLDGSESKRDQFKGLIVEQLFNMPTAYNSRILSFMSKFSLRDGAFVFTPSIKENQAFSDVRNFLLELNVIKLVGGRYVMGNEYVELFISAKEKTTALTPAELKRLLQEKEELGRAAEDAILEYERKRLSQRQDLVSKIRHVGILDTKAGYDIASFTGIVNEHQIMIEVKAVPGSRYEFIWTHNEIETAKLNPGQYFLYLLPVLAKNRFNFNKLRIIRSPYAEIFEQKEKWNNKPLDYLITEASV